MKREIKPFEEVLQDTLSGISAMLPRNKEGWQVLCDTRPGVKKDRHPVTIASAGRKEEGYVIPVFCAEDVYDYYRSTKDEEAAIRYFADLFAKAQAPKTNESIQDLALLLCRDPLLFRRNVVGWFVRKDDPAAKDRPSLVFGDLALIFFVSLERFGTPGAVPIRDATKSRMPFCPDAEALAELAADNRSDIDPMVIRDLSEEYQRFAEGSTVYQISTMMGEHGCAAILYRSTQDFLQAHLGEEGVLLPVGTDTCLAVKVPGPVNFQTIKEEFLLNEEKAGKIPMNKRLSHTAYRLQDGVPVPAE